MQQKEFAATPTPLGIEDEEEVTYQSAPITAACYAANTKRSASKTTKRSTGKATEGNASEAAKRSTGKATKEVQKKSQFK